MNDNLVKQEVFWDKELSKFDSIYSHKKGKLSNLLDSILRWDMYARFEYTMEHSQPIKDRTFLDVGCGTGRYSIQLAKQGATRVTGLDIAEKMVTTCRERALAEDLNDRCSFFKSDLMEFQVKEKFDVCLGIGLFDYIKDPLPVVRRMRESVRDSVIMTFPRRWTWRAPLRKARLALKGCDVYFYTRPMLDRLLGNSGFGEYKIKKVGKLYCVTAFVDKA